MSAQNPVIVIPGITASQLVDRYPVSPDVVWSALQKSFERVALHPDDWRYERIEPARVGAEKVFALPYEELIADLRYDLCQPPTAKGELRPTPVFPFEYDWRQPLRTTEARLADFVTEVIDRTRLLRHYPDEWRQDPKVDFIGHSMGGLIIAGYLESMGSKARVGNVVSIGSPFRGSFEAVMKVTTGLAQLGAATQISAERDAARMTPALYHLLPEFEDAVVVDPATGLPTSLYDPALWQPAVVDTIAQYVKLYGLQKSDAKTQAQGIFSAILNEAREHRARILGLKLKSAGLTSRNWLCIVGVHSETRYALKVNKVQGKPLFDLSSDLRDDKWGDPDPNLWYQSGDGTVPYLGALPPFVPLNEVLCVTPKDFGYWEIGDQLLKGPVGLHGMLPKMNLINRLTAGFLKGEKRKGTWGRPAAGVPKDKWDPPVQLSEGAKD